MRRLILNKLRNAEGKNTFRMMYDPTQILDTTLDGFVAIFSVPVEDIVTETYLLSYYEEA